METQRPMGVLQPLGWLVWKAEAGMPSLTLLPVPMTWVSGFLKLAFSTLDYLG